ncbi:hypothetical protein ACFWCF_12135 [Rhodococcus sp. NPDC060090]|uniref:hypothetical protein n=1 Tax=Rhodococcus sp. NPDC060090 TaxID=3347056 RepID=UPI00366179FE
MAYTTAFDGRFEITPPLNRQEIDFLTRFAGSASGPHNAGRDGLPTRGRPLSWCQWVPTGDGSALEWDGDQVFYRYTEWLEYLIAALLAPRGHVMSGIVEVRTSAGDFGRITVRDNEVDAQISRTNRTRRPGRSCAAVGRSAVLTTAITGYPPVTG